MDNLGIYNKVRVVPADAQRPISGGRLKGMTDINPMWRINTLTEQFGTVGFGWYYTIEKQWIEESPTGERAAFCNIHLFIKMDGEWSAPITGTGGSMYIANEKGGKYTDDECFKKALTDAISVACKAIGIGADIYWAKDRTKYDERPAPPPTQPTQPIDDALALALDDVKRATTREEVRQINANWAAYKEDPTFRAACNSKYQSLPKEEKV